MAAKTAPATTTTMTTNAIIADEPRPADGKDWVLAPGNPVPNGGTASALSAIASRFKLVAATPIEASQNPYELLNHQVPIAVIIKRNGLGLQHFCRSGVTMSEFLQNGYTLQDLCEFRDVSGQKGKQRALQALAIGLRASANHFRDYPDAFPLDGVRKLTGMDNNAMCEYFGLSYANHQTPLQCDGDYNWRVADVLKLGLTIDNLCDFGLQTTAQYDALMEGLSETTAGEMDRRLGTAHRHRQTWAKVDAAISYAGQKPPPSPPQPEHHHHHTPPPAPVVIHTPTPPPPAQIQHKLVLNTAASGPRPLSYEERAAQRAKMHGFKG